MLKKFAIIALSCLAIITTGFMVKADNSDRTDDFKIDSMKIEVNNKVLYEHGTAVGDTSFDYTPNINIGFNLEWSQKVISQNDFKTGDYILIDLFTVKGSDTVKFGVISNPKNLDDENGVRYGRAELINEILPDGSLKLSYRITFTANIVGKHDIGGTLSGSSSLGSSKAGDVITLSRDEVDFAIIDIIQYVPPVKGPNGVVGDSELPKQSKNAVSVGGGYNTITWRIIINEFLENQFEDYEADYTNRSYEDLIVEEMLDSYQSFTISTGQNIFKYDVPIYLYDKDASKEGYMKKYPFYFESYAGVGMQNLGSESKTTAEIEALVRSTAKSYAKIIEADPNNPSKTRERMIFNFGSPGDDGIRLGELNQATLVRLLTTLDESLQYVQSVVDSVAPGTADSAEIIGNYNDKETYGKWKQMVQIYQDSINYYNVRDNEGNLIGPYLYAVTMNVTSGVKVDDIDANTAGKVENRVVLSGGYTNVTFDSEQDNFWSADIRAKASLGDVVIYKENSLFNNDLNVTTEPSDMAGLLGNVSFEVYRKSDDSLLKFDYTGGKYVYKPSGTLSSVKTHASLGYAVISGLTEDTYYLKEIDVYTGFYTNQNQNIEFNQSNTSIEYVMVSNVPRTVSFTKVDSVDQTVTLSGAQFELFSYSGNDTSTAVKVTGFTKTVIGGTEYFVYDGSGQDILETSTDGMIRITNLNKGTYYLIETKAPTGYRAQDEKYMFELSDAYDGTDVLNIGNILNTKETAAVTGTKTWVDGDDTDKIRPETITLVLYADGDVVEDVMPEWVKNGNVWTYTFTGLEKYDGNREITYTVDEVDVSGYAKRVEGYDITNTHVPSTPDTPKLPSTGVASSYIGYGILVAGVVLLLMSKKSKKIS